MENPIDLKYSKDHEWIKIEEDVAIVGITDYAQDKLTDIVFVELPQIGKYVEQYENLCVVESVKSVSDIFSPISGKVVEVNKVLEESPELVNKEPFGGGWIAKLQIRDKADLEKLMTSEEYNEFITGKE
ncbi:MAG: glycine cleavage system protein GcvH [Candidatus Scalindua sp.]|nr:glycine cleavage system protein GcvH [Candidatus Scalindua sp.]